MFPRLPLLLAILLINVKGYTQSPAATPVQLTCEYRINPSGIDQRLPKLSWQISTNKRNWHQTAYQIIVASDTTLLKKNTGDIWNSGQIFSDENIQVKYQGAPLKSWMNCWWKVRVWDENNHLSAWSEPACWKMGILAAADWKGTWISSNLTLNNYQKQLKALPDFNMEPETEIWQLADTIRKWKLTDRAPAVYLRKEFNAGKPIKRATAYVCGLGLHELYLNGKRVGNEYLNPAYSDYQKTVLYNTYDVTNYLQPGANAIGVILGNGWYNLIVPHGLRFYAADYIDPPKLLMQIVTEYNDGTIAITATDTTWKYTTNGPLVYNDILSGETYDARKDMPGWNQPGYHDKDWATSLTAPAPQGILRSQQLFPIRKLSTLPVTKVEATPKGYRLDFGKAICGWAQIKIHGKTGQQIKVQYPGSAGHTLGRYQTDYFILNGSGEEIFEPRFSYNGFRYITIEGLDYTPAASDVTGIVVATDLPSIGTFSCSNEQLNRVQEVLLNTIRNYITHLPNDPTREKSGWTQDIENGFDVNAFNYDVTAMYLKWQQDFNDIVHANGYVPPVVPGRFDGPTINGPWWGGMIVYNVAKLYDYYQDKDIVSNSYEPMKKYIGYLTGIADDHIVQWGLGDWMEPFRADPGGRPTTTPIPLTSTIAYYHYVQSMANFAALLHKTADVAYFKKLAAAIKESYNRHFLDAATGKYAQGSQASQLLSLYFDLVPEKQRPIVIQQLQAAIAAHKGHLSTGFVATPFLLTTLSDLGLKEEAYTMATKNDFPSWFGMIFNSGDAVMKENWEGGLVQMPSLGGPIGYWYYYSLAGIQPATPAFKSITINPSFINDLSWVNASYQSMHGNITSNWKRTGHQYQLQINIPANTTAVVHLPAGSVSESNQPLKAHREMKVMQVTEKETVVRIGSGEYDFEVEGR